MPTLATLAGLAAAVTTAAPDGVPAAGTIEKLFAVGGPSAVLCAILGFLIYKGIPTIIKRQDEQLAARDVQFMAALKARDDASRAERELYERTLTTIRAEHRADRNADRAEFVAAIKSMADAVHELRSSPAAR